MDRRLWIAGLVLCGGLIDRHAASGEPLVHVRLMEQAEVPPATRERAQEVATRAYHLSGITLIWVEAEPCSTGCLTVRIVTEPVGGKSRDPRVLAVAPSTREARGINLWIFYPRIRVYSAELGMDASQLLGYVIAHELGHLLLPSGVHSVTGLMRTGWDRAQVQAAAEGWLTFMPQEADLIRKRLRAKEGVDAPSRQTLPVAIVDQAGLRGSTIDAIQQRVAAIYDAVGVTITWTQLETTRPTLIVIIRKVPRKRIQGDEPMGIAPLANTGKGRQAWVFHGEVERIAVRERISASELLSYVIAHELGHLLLPPFAHSAAGIMRAHWGAADYVQIAGGSLTFTESQADSIRATLTNRDLQG